MIVEVSPTSNKINLKILDLHVNRLMMFKFDRTKYVKWAKRAELGDYTNSDSYNLLSPVTILSHISPNRYKRRR